MNRPTVRKVDHVAGPSEWDDGYGRRWCSENAANEANAERFRVDTQTAAEEAARKNAEAMTPTDDEQRDAEILALHRASAAHEIHNAEIVAAGLDKPGDWEGHPPPPMLEDAARQGVTEDAKEDDEELLQNGIRLYGRIEEAIETHAKLDDAILKDIIGTRVLMAQLKTVLNDLLVDFGGA